MHVVNTIPNLSHQAGGTSQAVALLAKHLALEELCDVTICTFDAEDTLSVDNDQPALSLNLVSKQPYLWCLLQDLNRFEETLRDEIGQTESYIIHDHGLWLPIHHRVATVARELKAPRVVSSHGMLEPWALQHRAWKKRAALCLYQRRDLISADVLHATSSQEAEHLRGLGFQNPIAVIPNGVTIPEAFKKESSSGGKRTALFLSRLHPKKGLPMFVEAWAEVQPEDWHLVLVGPDEGGHRSELEALVRAHGLVNDITFLGPVEDSKKWGVYRCADLFVLPTHSENFGIVVAEALASGLPVITTKGAPWEELETHSCGWWIDIGVKPLVKALEEAIQLSDEERLAMGQRGRKLVERRFTWPQVARQMYEVYRWVLGDGPQPECVRLN